MAVETYMLTREYGPDSWARLLPTIFVSDRVSVWLPSGRHIQEAHDKGFLPFSISGFIDLLDANIIRVTGREDSYDSQSAHKLMYSYDENDPVQKYIRTLIDIGGDYSDFLHLHKTSDSEANQHLAYQQIRDRANPESALYYRSARELVDRHLQGHGVLHPVVEERAREFAEMEQTKIAGQAMRDCVKYINRYTRNETERRALHLTFQLMRLSLEHGNVMKNLQCNVFFEHKGYTRSIVDVAGLESAGISARHGFRDSLKSVLDLMDMILSSRRPRNPKDIIKLHQRMSSYHEHLWNLIRAPGVEAEAIKQELQARAKDYELFRKLLGETWPRKISAPGGLSLPVADVMINWIYQGAIAEFLSSIGPLSIPSLVFAAESVRRTLVDRKEKMQKDPKLWPVALAVGKSKITRADIQETVKIIERVLAK